MVYRLAERMRLTGWVIRITVEEALIPVSDTAPATHHARPWPRLSCVRDPVAMIDRAVATALLPPVILCSFGDMLRVPGTRQSLLDAKSLGADVRILYSPLDALQLARSNPAREIVFFVVGFETTAPANAMAVWQASREQLANFSMLVSHVLVPPAMEAVLASPHCLVQAFLAAGHACMVTGYEEYFSISRRHGVPIVVTGFEPLDLLEGVLMLVAQLEGGRTDVENQYTRAVQREGNLKARNGSLKYLR